MATVAMVLGGSLSVALNALKTVTVTRGGGTLLCSRQLGSLNPISVIKGRSASSLKRLLELVSITEAWVDRCVYWGSIGAAIGTRPSGGVEACCGVISWFFLFGRYLFWYPLFISLTLLVYNIKLRS